VEHSEEGQAAAVPTPEELAGRELYRLRKGRGWSQEEVARRMTAYGYTWHQTTVGRVETAERPLRLNEVVHLAAMFQVPVTQFLLPVDMTLQEIDDAIEEETKARDEIRERAERYRSTLEAYDAQREEFSANYRQLAEELERANSHLEIMRGLREILERGQGEEAIN
jgi:transcriptional regulator with XRE-family HTH domain